MQQFAQIPNVRKYIQDAQFAMCQ